MKPVKIIDQLLDDINDLTFSPPVTHVYNPLIYARRSYQKYFDMYGRSKKEILMIGMNPGPFGMVQTGIPFGDVTMVRDWLNIKEHVSKPVNEHPKRPVLGFDCPRGEVSGSRLWGWARDTFGTPDAFFERIFIYNYCPLCFLEESGRNRTPDKLPNEERLPLLTACNIALQRLVDYYQPGYLIAIGVFAEQRIKEAIGNSDIKTIKLLHPSPANPHANRGWAESVSRTLLEHGICV